MRNRASENGGRAVVNLASGEVAHPPPRAALDAARRSSSVAATHFYGPTGGQAPLREAVATRMRERGVAVEADRVVITSGAKQALFHACIALLDPGDEALVPVPSWPTYREAVRLAGAVPIAVRTEAEEAFKVSPEQLEAAATTRARALFLASPNNPTGTVYGVEELKAIAEWALSRDLWVIVDEVYDELVYPPAPRTAMLAAAPWLGDRCVTVDSIAKRWAMPGWRVGWLIGPPEVVGAATRIQSHTSSHVPNICQAAAWAAVEEGEATVRSIGEQLTAGREVALAGLAKIDGAGCAAPLGAFYAFADVGGLLERRAGEDRAASTAAFAEELFAEARTAVVAGEAFGAPGFVRISFGVPPDDLAEGLRRLVAHAGG